MHFTKMQGLGNDYLYVYGEVPANIRELSIRLSNRYFGAGSEMLMSGVGPSMAWSLNAYRTALEDGMIDLDQSDEFEKREPWDELERSVIANLADDVKVKIVGDDVEILVERSVDS